MKKAFTLIELLIVVAIIAILAAIAVPNFLEAQTRSKVSRTMADTKAIVTAMEAYAVDHNFIPVRCETAAEARAANYFGTLEFLKWIDYRDNKINGIGSRLTSPVSYITNIPFDTFNTRANKLMRPHNFDFFVSDASVFLRGASRRITSKGGQPGDPFGTSFIWPNDKDATLQSPTWRNPIRYIYILQSAGPDLLYFDGSNQSMYYDPTNGTVSRGEILYIDTLGFRGGKR